MRFEFQSEVTEETKGKCVVEVQEKGIAPVQWMIVVGGHVRSWGQFE